MHSGSVGASWRSRPASSAAWAVPIKSANGRVLGAVTVYRPLAGTPQSADLDLMVHAARLAGIAIERRRGEEALRASETKFRRLYERVLEGVYQCAPDGRLLEVNPAFVKMLGYDSAEEIYALLGHRDAVPQSGRTRRVRAARWSITGRSTTPNSCCIVATARRSWCSRARASFATTSSASSPTRARWRTSPPASAPSRPCSPRRNARR